MKKTVVLGLLVGLALSWGCTGQGAWDLFRILDDEGSGGTPPDILDSLYNRYTFNSSTSPEIDDSGNGIDATVNGATWVNDAARGGVLEFDGTNDNVTLPAIFGAAPAFTISAWVSVDSLATINSIYAVDPFPPQGIRFFIFTDGTLDTEVGSNFPAITGTSFAFGGGDFGLWFHVAAVYDKNASTMKLYINGQRDTADDLVTAQDVRLGAGRIGGAAGPPDSWFDGRIDDVRIYSRVLSDAEINQVYNATI